MEYTQKLVYQSNYWYNDGLKRARIRDMSGAVTSLKKSLQYNRENIAARNLLGLVYYGRGEVGEALVEWILSKNFQAHENIANYYIKKLQENPTELEKVNQAIRKFNQSLSYCYQDGEDLAIIQLKKVVADHPTFLKAYQLLSLLYLHTQQYGKARHTLKEAHRLDTTNDITLRYMHEMNELRRNRALRQADKEGKKEKPQTVTYNIGNETIIQPASAGVKENAGLMTIVNIVIGLVVGVAVMWFLIMPAVNSSTAERTNRQVKEFSSQIAEQEAQISALQTELEQYRANSEATETAQQTAASTQDSYEIVLNMYDHYQAEDMSDAAMVEELLKVNPDSLGAVGREQFDTMTEDIYGRYCETLYYTAQQNFEVANYADAIANLNTVMQMNAGYDDGQAMWLLAQSYSASGDTENANTWTERVQTEYPNIDTSRGGDSSGEDASE
uniref:tetratricopeptide repeat protein n=1 Tax=Lachnoclostridium phocaeense TaxID=1871021 RepID=UPI0026DC53C5|nr:tetratricopeptide repeat protein [Lachnoclostridium phocaeense]